VNVLQSLPVLKDLFDLGINYINYPILTKEGKTHFENADRYYVLLNHIEGQNTREYNIKHAYEELIEIHKATEGIQSEITKEDFKVRYVEDFERGFEKYRSLNILKPYLEEISDYWEKFQELSRKLSSKKFKGYITHSDAFGNIIKNGEELYIIDWDDLISAPLERDLWFFIYKDEIVQLYKKNFEDFDINWDFVKFYVYNRFFDDLLGCFEMLDKGVDEKEVIKEIEQDCINWTYAFIKECEEKGRF
jgi:hypothetical protein